MLLINLAIIFIICLALSFFSIQNPEYAEVTIFPGLEVHAPIAIELIVASGLGAVLAWMLSSWIQFQRFIAFNSTITKKDNRIKELEKKIEELENKLEESQAEIQSLQPVLPPSEDTKAAVANS